MHALILLLLLFIVLRVAGLSVLRFLAFTSWPWFCCSQPFPAIGS
jgi:hypothetical protein